MRNHNFFMALFLAGLAMVASAMASNTQTITAYSVVPITGQVLDRTTGKPISGAVVSASWFLRPVGSSETRLRPDWPRLYIEQSYTNAQGKFTLQGWKGRKHVPSGWELAPALDPMLSLFAEGYRVRGITNSNLTKTGQLPHNQATQAVRRSAWHKKKIELIPLEKIINGQGDSGLLEMEWASWKWHIQAEYEGLRWISRPGWAAEQLLPLYRLLHQHCIDSTEEQNKIFCLDVNSELGTLLSRSLIPVRQTKNQPPQNASVLPVGTSENTDEKKTREADTVPAILQPHK